MAIPDPPEPLDLTRAAAEFRLGYSALARAARLGEIPSHWHMNARRVYRADVAAWLRAKSGPRHRRSA